MDKEIKRYKDLCAEHEWLVELSGPLHRIKYSLERVEKWHANVKETARALEKEAASFVRGLEKRIEQCEAETKIQAAAILRRDHGINLGERIPYSQPGVGRSGYIRVEEVRIYFRPLFPEDTFIVSGPRFRKDGSVGKQTESVSLRVMSGT